MYAQSIAAYFWLWLCADSFVLGMRGPHHPRDQKVVQAHTHYKPVPPAQGKDHVKLTQDSKLTHDEDHIREDMSGQVSHESLKDMSPEEMEFYYFKLHDFDNNTKLDGLELLKAIEHTMHHESEGDKADEDENQHRNVEVDLAYFTQLIDEVMLSDDTDNDGYLSYSEFTLSKSRDVVTKATEPKEAAAAQLLQGPTSP